jgi:zinc/manganese transport system substrate-binding protein
MRLNLAAAGVLILAGCSAPAAPSAPLEAGPTPVGSAPPIAVLGTENFYADLLTQIGGSRVSASSLLNDPNADPHAFESSTQAAVLVADARLVIVNGLGYDGFMGKLLAASSNPDRVVIDVQQLLGLADGVNAHIWYEPGTMPRVAAAVTAALGRIDPANAAWFGNREAIYLNSLQPVAAKIAEMKTRFGGAPVAFTEPVAGYLAPADVAAESDLLTSKRVRVLLYNSQVSSPITSQMHDLAVANGIPVVGIAETIPAGEADFQDWQLAQLNELEQALGAGG